MVFAYFLEAKLFSTLLNVYRLASLLNTLENNDTSHRSISETAYVPAFPISETHHAVGVLEVLDFGTAFFRNNGDDVEPNILLAVV